MFVLQQRKEEKNEEVQQQSFHHKELLLIATQNENHGENTPGLEHQLVCGSPQIETFRFENSLLSLFLFLFVSGPFLDSRELPCRGGRR